MLFVFISAAGKEGLLANARVFVRFEKKRKVAHVFRSTFMDIRVSGEAFRKTNV